MTRPTGFAVAAAFSSSSAAAPGLRGGISRHRRAQMGELAAHIPHGRGLNRGTQPVRGLRAVREDLEGVGQDQAAVRHGDI